MSFGISGLSATGGSITGLGAPAWIGGGMRNYWFDTGNLTPVMRPITSTGTGAYYSGDAVYRMNSGAFTVTDYLWSYTVSPNNRTVETVQRTVSNSGLIIPATGSDSMWTYQATGTGMLILSSSSGSRIATGFVATSTGTQQLTYTFLHSAYDSLRYALTTGIDTRISGKIPAASMPIFSVQDHTTPTYVRNTGCWAYGIDLTPVSPWNSAGGNYQAGTLVSPKHILFAAHYPIAAGSTIRFVTDGNAVVTRTITGIQTLPTYVSYYPDCTLGGLDSDVPATISYARILPSTYTGKLPGGVTSVPTLSLDYEEKAIVTDLTSITTGTGYYGAMVNFQRPTDTTRISFYKDKIGRDNGNPAFVVIDGKLVLLNVWTFGNAGQGTNIMYWKDALNIIMANLGGGYSLTEVDLSAFPSYA